MASVDRRDFLKLVGVSASSAAAVGCAEKVEKLIPYVVQPEGLTPGNAVIYASTCTECSAGCGLHVRTRESRPIKLEGNPENPINQGALCARAQAAVSRTYLPDRYPSPMRLGEGGLEATSWEEALTAVAAEIQKAPAKLHVLGGDPGTTASEVVDLFLRAVGGGGRTVYESFSGETLREATRTVFGVASEPVFDVSSADVILDFGAEMLETGPSVVEHERQWSEARDVATHEDGGARLVYVGPRLSLTASSSDQWLPAKAGSEGALALGLAAEVARAKGVSLPALSGNSAASAAEASGVDASEIESLAKGLAKAKAAVALPPGVGATSRRAIAATQAVLVLNEVLGATGTRMIVPPPTGAARESASYKDVLALIEEMKAGKVGVLLIHDANPLYSLPESAGFAEALKQVGTVVSFATARDETSEAAHWVLPSHAPLESWGDGAPRAGVRTLRQPSFRPLYDTRQLGDALLELGRAQGGAVAAKLPTGDFRSLVEAAWADTDFRAALKRGGVYGATPHQPVAVNAGLKIEAAAPLLTGGGSYTLMPVVHPFFGEGGGAALPWLQEVPEPITSIAWDSWAEISIATAKSLGVESGDIVTIAGSAGSLDVGVFVRGGIRDDVVAIPTGQGHTVGHYASKAGDGMPGVARGVNVAALLPGDAVDESGAQAWVVEQVSITPTGRYRRLPQAQFHDNKRGRELGEAITLSALLGGDDGHHGDGHAAAALAGGVLGGGDGGHGDGHGSHEIIEEYDPADDARDQQYVDTFRSDHPVEVSPYRWGLSIDLDKCTGCGSCITACYVENNIPVVGEAETRNLRQMSWLRLDRWVGDGEATLEAGRIRASESRETLGNTDIRNSPMMCQQCGSAPCEPVCPVIATYHNEEGLNAMIYNRCIGTRYCANNCPYKVRRFNYFDNQLTKWPEPMELGLNPDVTVRGQGVMEKCNLCVQRIQEQRQIAKNEGRIIGDGEVQTACQQTCGTGAIVFGNLRDDESRVSKLADDDKRAYHALQVLNTRPGLTYLKKVVRGPVQG